MPVFRIRYQIYLPLLWAAVGLLLFSAAAAGQADLEEVEIDGLLIDRTLTRVGHEFFRSLVAELDAPDGIPGVNVVVRERVSGQWGSLVWIEAQDRTVFRSFLRPRGDGVEGVAQQGARALMAYLLRLSETDLPQQEDLGEDEI